MLEQCLGQKMVSTAAARPQPALGTLGDRSGGAFLDRSSRFIDLVPHLRGGAKTAEPVPFLEDQHSC